MKAWVLHPDGEVREIEVRPGDALRRSREFIGDTTLDITRVRYRDKLCSMVVGDESSIDGSPVNEAATKAYLANCHPGTTHHIGGTAVVFDGLLP